MTGPEVIWSTQLARPDDFLDRDRLGDDERFRAVNLMKGGVVYSNFTTTVSPNHAVEARHGDGVFGLGSTLWTRQVKFGGVLNGVDYDTWNPEIDPLLPPAIRRSRWRASTRRRDGCGNGSGCGTPGARSSPMWDASTSRRGWNWCITHVWQ